MVSGERLQDHWSSGIINLTFHELSKISTRIASKSRFDLLCFRSCTHSIMIEPRSEKTGLRGFRPGPTQPGLYSHRRWLET